MRNKKTLKELTLKDNFMFGAVMSDENNCRRLLELILQFPIEREEGKAEGLGLAIMELLSELGAVPEAVSSKIMQETDIEVLKRWHKLAAKSGSMEQFMENM